MAATLSEAAPFCTKAYPMHAIESWQDHADLHEREDYPQLVALCEAEVATRPDDLHAHERLGHAYVLNGDFDSAIRAMTPIHHRYPEIDAFAHIILDALFASGRNEQDYDWVEQPIILRLDSEVCDICYDYLRPKRKPRSASSMYCHLMLRAYLAFAEMDLFQALASDPRFHVVGEDAWDSEIRVVPQRRRRTM